MRRVHTLLAQQSLALVNADITIIAEQPKMAPHIDSIVQGGVINAQPMIKVSLTEDLALAECLSVPAPHY